MKIVVLTFCAVATYAADIKSLAFMSGCWAGSRGEESFEELWTKAEAGSLLGVSRTVKGGRTTFTEYVQVRPNETGDLVMHVQLKLADKTTPFKLAKSDGNQAVFENPQHDFPQRIIYRAEGADRLLARIEGPQGGKTVGIDYPMKRTQCGR